MFNHKSYDARTISVLEIIAAYTANLYYHHFYSEAERLRVDNKVRSVTDGYTHAIKAYLTALTKPEYYRKSVIGIHNYYQRTTKFTNISMKDCLNDIVRQFVPDEYYHAMGVRQRETILHNVLLDSVKNFSNQLMCGTLLMNIIDNHNDPTTAPAVKQKMLDCLLFEREKVYRKFFSTLVDPKNNTADDMKVSAQMKREITKMVSINKKMVSRIESLEASMDDSRDIIKEKNELIGRLKVALRDTHDKYVALKKQTELQTSRPPISIADEHNNSQHETNQRGQINTNQTHTSDMMRALVGHQPTDHTQPPIAGQQQQHSPPMSQQQQQPPIADQQQQQSPPMSQQQPQHATITEQESQVQHIAPDSTSYFGGLID